MKHDFIGAQLASVSFLATPAAKMARVRKPRAKPTKPGAKKAKATKKSAETPVEIAETVTEAPAAVLKTEGCFNPGPKYKPANPASIVFRGIVRFTIPSGSAIVIKKGRAQIIVHFGRGLELVIAGPYLQKLDLSADVDVDGFLTVRKRIGKPKRFGSIVLVRAHVRRPALKLTLDDVAGAAFSKTSPDGTLSLERLAPAQQAAANEAEQMNIAA